MNQQKVRRLGRLSTLSAHTVPIDPPLLVTYAGAHRRPMARNNSTPSRSDPDVSPGSLTRLQNPTGELLCSRLAHGSDDPVGPFRRGPELFAARSNEGGTTNGRHTPIQGTTSRSLGNVEKGAHGRLGAVTAYPIGLATGGDRADECAKTPAVPQSGSWGERTATLRRCPNCPYGWVEAEAVTGRRDGHPAGWSNPVARWPHKPEVARSNRAPASDGSSCDGEKSRAHAGSPQKWTVATRRLSGQSEATTIPASTVAGMGHPWGVTALGFARRHGPGAPDTRSGSSIRGHAVSHGKHLTRQTYFGVGA